MGIQAILYRLIYIISWLTSYLLFNITGFVFVVLIQIIRIPALWIQSGLDNLSFLIKQKVQESLGYIATNAWWLISQAWVYSVEAVNWVQVNVPVLFAAILIYGHALKDWVVEIVPWIQEEMVKLLYVGTDVAHGNYKNAIESIGKQLFANTTRANATDHLL